MTEEMKPGTILKFSKEGLQYLFGRESQRKQETVRQWRFIYLGYHRGESLAIVKLGTKYISAHHGSFLEKEAEQ